MTISRVHSAPGWAVNEKLTSAQANQIDLNTTYALDKRSGQTDTLDSHITVSSSGTIGFSSGGSGLTGAAGSNLAWQGAAQFRTGNFQHLAQSVAFNTAPTTFDVLSPVTMNCAVTIGAGHSFGCASPVTITGATIFGNDVTFTGIGPTTVSMPTGTTLSVGGPSDLSGNVTITGSVNSTTMLNFTGTAVPTYATARTLTQTLVSASPDRDWIVGPIPAGCFVGSPTSSITGYTRGPSVAFAAELPHGATWINATVFFRPDTGHGGAPAGLPVVSCYQVDLTNGTVTGLALQTASYGSAGAYEVYTGLTATLGGGVVIDRSRYRYVVVFASEYGANAQPAMVCFGAEASIQTATMDRF